jgi:hypothetical protein
MITPVRTLRSSLIALLIAVFVGMPARAGGLPDTATLPRDSPFAQRGELELRVIERALEDLALEPDLDPWGKPVCEIRVKVYPIFLEEDLLPTWINVFHRRTRERVIRRALTVRPGDPFDVLAYEDAERAIRDPNVFSVVTVVPTRADDPECVDVLVAVRDIWSLRAGFSIVSNGSAVSSLYLGITENNFLGTADALSFGVDRGPGSTTIGPAYLSQHFAGSPLTVYGAFDVIVENGRGGLEGTASAFQVARPLRAERERWGWTTSFAHDDRIVRRYIGTRLVLRDYDGELVPDRYRSRYVGGSASFTRAWGDEHRTHLTPGVLATWRDHEPVPRDPTLSEAAIAAYAADHLPRSELAIGPTLGLSFFRNRYFRVVNVDTYGVSEELRRGYLVSFSTRLSEPTLGSDTRYVTFSTNASWRLPLGSDAFFSTAFGHSLRADGRLSDVSVSGSARLVLPTLWAGRWVMHATVTELLRNGGNARLTVGGDNGLRGYPTGAFEGTRSLTANIEWRSKPARIRRVHLGGVAFVDVGSAWNEGDFVTYHPSVGIGGRIVLPATGTVVRVADLSLPLNPAGRPVLSLGVGQAF